MIGMLNFARKVGNVALAPFFLATLMLASGARAQTEDTRTLQREDGTSVTYTVRTYPPDAHLLRPDAKPVPVALTGVG